MRFRKYLLPFTRPEIYFPILWTLFCWLAFAYKLGEIPPYHTDENYYVESVKTMVDTGDYLTPYYHDKKRFAKPILIYWLMAAAYKTFGANLAAARLWSVTFGALSVLFSYLLARRLFGNRIALLSALILPSFYLHFLVSRWATTDMALNFFIIAACYFFISGLLDAERRARNFYFFYAVMALGFLAKGPPAVLIPGLTVIVYLIAIRNWNAFKELRLGRGTLIVLGVNFPWFASMFYLHGDEFRNHLVGAEIHDRVIHGTPFSLYFVGVLFRYYLPWSLFFVSALLLYLGAVSNSENSGERFSFPRLWENVKKTAPRLFWAESRPLLFCLTGILVPLAVFTLLRIQHSRYMLSASPFVAMIVAHFFDEFADAPKRIRNLLFKIPFVLTVGIYALIALVLSAAVLIFHEIGPVPWGVDALPFVLIAGGAMLIFHYTRRGIVPLIFTLAIVQTTTLGLVSGEAIPFFNRYPMKRFAAEIIQHSEGSDRIGIYRLGNNRARLGVLTAHVVLDFDNAEELRKFFSASGRVYVVMREADWKDEFAGDSLRLQASDIAWKAERIKTGEALKTIWSGGAKTALENLSEPLVMLTNR